MKKFLKNFYGQAVDFNDVNVSELLAKYWPFESMLDVGCWDWEKTLVYAKNAWTQKIYWIEIVAEKVEETKAKWIETFSLITDKYRWPFDYNFLDCVVSNQVIEHLTYNIDNFISEASRVLKKWWYLITSINNLASWHNICATLFLCAPFDLTNSSKKVGDIWNPLALHQWEIPENGASWTHKTILATRWMNDWFSVYGFGPVKRLWSWYYPFPAIVGKWLPWHSAFITLANKKN